MGSRSGSMGLIQGLCGLGSQDSWAWIRGLGSGFVGLVQRIRGLDSGYQSSFEKPGDGFGMDLAAINVQRAREHGVPGYNKFREYCGMPRARNFWDLIGILPNKTVHRYSQIYRHVDDIDLWSAAISEYPLQVQFSDQLCHV
ncbi:peroxidasin-like protein [Caerostris extrusa]|uniref:Peroxidasin-like protein n=1 Tax=Caerostris extrusa TaxID=172846 RepID=A0AAV4X8G7_CAEEX|nr:peroxidasin-like protein [Caerostris extrusa]